MAYDNERVERIVAKIQAPKKKREMAKVATDEKFKGVRMPQTKGATGPGKGTTRDYRVPYEQTDANLPRGVRMPQTKGATGPGKGTTRDYRVPYEQTDANLPRGRSRDAKGPR